jgi:hypothetical protein
MDEGLERSSPLLKTEKDFMSLKGDKPKAVDLDSLVDGDLVDPGNDSVPGRHLRVICGRR